MACKKKGRGRLNSVELIPEDLRVRINAALRERRLTQTEILDTFNALLNERGHKPLSKSALGRYASMVEEHGEAVREARAAASAIVGRLEDEKSDVGRALTEIVSTLAMNAVQDGGLEIEDLNKLALLVQRLEGARKMSVERELKVREEGRKQALEEAAKAVEAAGARMGLSHETRQEIRQELGIK